ncbi:MAG: DUF6454 family protein [Balneolales bacterium]
MSILLMVLLITSSCDRNDDLAINLHQLTRDTQWEPAGSVMLDFNTYHTQGLTKIDDLFYLSSVEIIVPTSRTEDAPYDRPARLLHAGK